MGKITLTHKIGIFIECATMMQNTWLWNFENGLCTLTVKQTLKICSYKNR